MKKIGLLFVTIIMMMLLAVSVSAEYLEYTEGYYTYTVTDGEATIVAVDKAISGDVIIPETLGGYTVTELTGGHYDGTGFYACDKVYSVYLPSTIEAVGSSFYLTPNLVEIIVDDNNPYLISKDGILYNKDMTQILVYPGGKAYDDFIVPLSVKFIDGFQYSGCSHIKTLSFEKGSQLQFFNGDSLFYFTDIDELIMPATCSVENIELGGSCRVNSLKFEQGRPKEVFVNNGNYGSNRSRLGQLKKIELISSFVGIAEKGLYTAFYQSLETVIIRNPKCDIYDAADTIDKGAAIYGYANSTAQAYAKRYNRTFVTLECEQPLYEYKYVDGDCYNNAYECYECKTCGDIKDKKEFPDTIKHSYVTVVTSPTCTSQGFTTYTCECKDSCVADYVNATGHKDDDVNGYCDVCGFKVREKTFWEKITDWFKDFFDKLFGWMKRK